MSNAEAFAEGSSKEERQGSYTRQSHRCSSQTAESEPFAMCSMRTIRRWATACAFQRIEKAFFDQENNIAFFWRTALPQLSTSASEANPENDTT